MTALWLLLILCGVSTLLASSYSSGASEESGEVLEDLACEQELVNFCKLNSFRGFEQNFEARMCLRAFRDMLSEQCLQRLQVVPSIVEPCYQEISTYCQDVEPGDNRILSCLVKQDYAGIARDCQLALSEYDWTAELDVIETDDDASPISDDLIDEMLSQWVYDWAVEFTKLMEDSSLSFMDSFLERITSDLYQVEERLSQSSAVVWFNSFRETSTEESSDEGTRSPDDDDTGLFPLSASRQDAKEVVRPCTSVLGRVRRYLRGN